VPHPRSNVLVIVTDQERAAGPYEPDTMAQFRVSQLPRRGQLAREGLQFSQHRIVSSACVPSRASMFTGQPPSVHGVRNTDGLAKRHDDPAMRWLQPMRPPTLGHYARALGMETVYMGKWHLSHADLADPRGRTRMPSDSTHAAYTARDVLDPYGFSGWIGPDPHGASPRNAGTARDPFYVARAVKWLRARARDHERPPFVMVVSLVNPHDIVFWPGWSLWNRRNLDLAGVPMIEAATSEEHIPDREPSVLAAYREQYPRAYGPRAIVRHTYNDQRQAYRRFYCALLRRTDALIGALVDAVDETDLHETTSVVLTADHGELLGAHGGLHQKWYNGFEEVLRVPLTIRAPGLGGGVASHALTSHLDLLPTLLGLAHPDGVQAPALQRLCDEGAPTLPGHDLLGSTTRSAVFFETQDHILEGSSRRTTFSQRFPRIGALFPMRYPPMEIRNVAVQALVAPRPRTSQSPNTPTDSATFKLIRYYAPDHADFHERDEWSLFDLSRDPCELHDLHATPNAAPVFDSLKATLAAHGLPSDPSDGAKV